MKALVLAAGYGTRLAPATDILPKALFPVGGEPVMGRMIRQLKQAGCTAVAVNTHHLADQVRNYLHQNDFGLPVRLSHEPEIQGTGGAIRQLSGFWDKEPFLVVNADLVTDIDLADVYRRHLMGRHPVTLVMHDHEPFNQVWVDENNQVRGFVRFADAIDHSGHCRLAFTGVHVMDARILPWISTTGFCDIIGVYRKMIDAAVPIHAHVVSGHHWQDMGSPGRYRDAVVAAMLPEMWWNAFGESPPATLRWERLSGDGSDRGWFRLHAAGRQIIMADHGITPVLNGSEVNAFVNIGTHLYDCGLPVPRIYSHDGFSGLVFIEDLGDSNMQSDVETATDAERIEARYRQAIDIWLNLTLKAMAGFDPAWTCQTRAYDLALILEKECRYFVEAFLNGYLDMSIDHNELADEFQRLAAKALSWGIDGLIHRDLQSRNIMVRNGRLYLIDFQGARYGPIQYDLASLLIDPYTALDQALQQRLLDHAAVQASRRLQCDPERIVQGFYHCAVTRNLQMLGAFGFLSRAKGKTGFERWIPHAAGMLARHIDSIGHRAYPRLNAIARAVGGGSPPPAHSLKG